MTPDQFLIRCKQLWHVAPEGAWDSISQTGLRTAQQLIEAADLDDAARTELLTTPRPAPVTLTVDGRTAVLRDQEQLLRPDLTDRLAPGTSVGDWVSLLNRRVYLFTDKAAMTKAVAKLAERDGPQEVLTFSPLRLLDAVRSQIELSAQNAGAAARKSDPSKGKDTFVSITRAPDRKPAEVTIVDGLDDLAGIVMRVERHELGQAPVSIL